MKTAKFNIKRTLAIMLSVLLVMSNLGFLAYAEDIISASDDTDEVLVEEDFSSDVGEPVQEDDFLSYEIPLEEGAAVLDEPVPYEQTAHIDDVRIIVTADAGVFAPDTALDIQKVYDDDIAQKVESALGVSSSDGTILLHTLYSFSGAEMNGSAKAVMEELGLSDLQDQYPDSEISSSLFEWDGDYKDAYRVSADISIQQNKAEFTLSALTIYDLVTVIRIPEPAQETAGESDSKEQVRQSAEGEAAGEEAGQGESIREEVSGEELTEEAVKEATEDYAEEHSGQTAEQEAEELAEETTCELSEEAVNEPTDELSEEAVNEPTDELSEEAVNGSMEESAGEHGTSKTWADLQNTITGAETGSTIRLTQSYTALPTDSPLSIPELKPLTIDLNGYTLDRGLADGSPVQNGYVLDVPENSNLTLKDSQGGGAITGGNTSGDVGGIRNEGILILENVTVTGNKATGSGGGIYNNGGLIVNGGAITNNSVTGYHGGGIYNIGTLNLNGGTISGNSAGSQGGGILQGGTMNISRAPVVRDNTCPAGNNIYLRNNNPTMAVTSKITDGADIWVTSARGAAPITTGYGAKNGSEYPGAFFHADNSDYTISLANGEVNIASPFSVTVSADDAGSLSADKTTVAQGDTVTVTVLDGTPLNMIKVTYEENGTTEPVEFTPGTDNAGTFVMPDANVTVFVSYERVSTEYINEAGEKKRIYALPLRGSETELTGNGNFYVVNRNLTMDQRLAINVPNGMVSLILADGCTLTAAKGIDLEDSNSLVIYCQSEGTGKLVARGEDYYAGIGTKNNHPAGRFTIYGGTVEATGGSGGAGIGGGFGGSGGTVNIKGGTVKARGGGSGAGIGGGRAAAGGTITISGGTVTATGGDSGAGIGGGTSGRGGTINISGGTVTAESGINAAGIGGGRTAAGGTITISGGTVTAIAKNNGVGNGAGIGSGHNSSSYSTNITISGGTVKATGYRGGAGIGKGTDSRDSVNTILTYDDNTREDIEITASSYSDSVTFQKPFRSKDGTAANLQGSDVDLSAISGKTLVAEDGTYRVEISAAEHGTVSAVKEKYQQDDNVVLTIAPDKNYMLGSLIVDGEDVTSEVSDSQYTFNMPAKDVTVEAAFASLTYTVTFDTDGGSEVDTQSVISGQKAIRPEEDPTKEGYTFTGWYQVTDVDAGTLADTEFDFENTVITENVTLKAVWEEMTAPEFKTQSLLLSGKIGVVFYMDLPEINGVDYSASKMTFTVPHGTCTPEAQYNPDFRNSAGNYYGFICYVNSIQMAEKITAKFHYTENSEEKTVERTFAAADYFASFDTFVEERKITDPYTIDLVHAVADFGHYVQPFLSAARHWTIGVDYEEMEKHYTESTSYDFNNILSVVSEKAIKVEGTDSDFAEIRHSLTLDSDTVINIYFKPADSYSGTFTASVDSGVSQTYTPGADGRYCVQISDIAAHALSKDHTINVTTDGGSINITVSALSYVNSALAFYNDENDADRKARNAVAAVYDYSRTADAYKKAHPND